MNENQAQAVIDALSSQRNDAMNALALVTADLAIAKQDIEGLNKIIADEDDVAHGLNAEVAKKHLVIKQYITEAEKLEEEIDRLEASCIEKDGDIKEYMALANQRARKLEARASVSQDYIDKLNRQAQELVNYKRQIGVKNGVISGLEVQLKDLRGDHLPKGAI